MFFLKRIELEHIMSHKYAKQNGLVYILLEPCSLFETRYFKTLQQFLNHNQWGFFYFELYVPRVKNVTFDDILSDSLYAYIMTHCLGCTKINQAYVAHVEKGITL